LVFSWPEISQPGQEGEDSRSGDCRFSSLLIRNHPPLFRRYGRTALCWQLSYYNVVDMVNRSFSLELHAHDLEIYYGALAVHPHHNYNEGRSNSKSA
jgi:hypothetical protein